MVKDCPYWTCYGDDFLFYENGNIHSYDHKTDASKCIPVTEPSFSVCFTYTPSLVFFQGMKSIYSENQISPLLGHDSIAPLRLIS